MNEVTGHLPSSADSVRENIPVFSGSKRINAPAEALNAGDCGGTKKGPPIKRLGAKITGRLHV